MGCVANIFKRHGGRYLQTHGKRMLPSHRRALVDIGRCRTPALGGHLYRCGHCGHYHYSYHCCGNRHCPQCRGQWSQRWIEQRKAELLPVPYFHLVFTLPEAFRRPLRANQRAGYRVLFRAAAEALLALAADQRYVGGRIGILAVLHTWTRAMVFHPHVHMLVPGVGLSDNGRMLSFSRRGYLVPVKALSKIFREKFLAMIREAVPGLEIPGNIRQKDWVVFCKHLDMGPEKVVEYLGRYLNRVAVTDHRVGVRPEGAVIVRYRATDGSKGSVRLGIDEFFRRYLQHVLPKGFNKVRRYGLFAPSNRRLLQHLRCQLLLTQKTKLAMMLALAEVQSGSGHRPARLCPQCKTAALERALPIKPNHNSRSPPPQRSVLQ